MAFVKWSKRGGSRGTRRNIGEWVTVAIYKGGMVGQQRYSLAITMSTDLLARLRWRIGDYVAIMIGEGPDAGFVKLQSVSEKGDGYKLCVPGGERTKTWESDADRLRWINKQPGVVKPVLQSTECTTLPAVRVEHEVIVKDNGLLIALPDSVRVKLGKAA